MTDLFGRNAAAIQLPLTGDTAILSWSGTVIASATSIMIAAGQSIANKHTLGNLNAVIVPGMPNVSISLGRILFPIDAPSVFALPGWKACNPASLTISFSTCSAGSGLSFLITGAVVASYQLQAEAESTTVMDSLNIQALQIFLA